MSLSTLLVLAPLGLHADVEIEKHLVVEEPLELLARGRADPLDHVAALADHDRLLRLAVDHDRAVQPQDAGSAPLRLLEPVDDDGARERNLGVRELQQLFADDLGGEEPLRLVGQVVGADSAAPLPAAGR